MEGMSVKKIGECPERWEEAALWFSDKWGIPLEAYRESMEACLKQRDGVPQWYLALDGEGNIAAGAGVIENDFHDRPDLRPNLCALFVEETYRGRGIARSILDFARRDVGAMGFDTLYLVTDHREFYEKCGWQFFGLVGDSQGKQERMYMAHTFR